MRLLVATLLVLTTTSVLAQTPTVRPTPRRFFGRREATPQQVQPGIPGPAENTGAAQGRIAPQATSEAPAQLPPPPPVAEDTPRPRRTPKPESAERRAEKRAADREAELEGTPRAAARKSAKPTPLPAEASVSAVDLATSAVGDFLRASNEGSYSKAATFLTPQMQKYFDSEASAPSGGLMPVLDSLTKDGTIRFVKYATWRGRNEGGRLDANITYDLGTPAKPNLVTERHTFDLQKVDGKWRIVLTLPLKPGAPQPVDPDAKPAEPEAKSAPAPAAVSPAPEPQAAVPTPKPVGAELATKQPVAETQPSPDAGGSRVVPVSAVLEAAMKPGSPASNAVEKAARMTTTSALADAPWGAGR